MSSYQRKSFFLKLFYQLFINYLTYHQLKYKITISNLSLK